ncbi:hypothetical protein PT974_07279 [Cladobotryum mycophilum]|uniref:Ribosomal RNA methyltransferase FtsJ domain-containing protein n=1 Tax=Cladobotryum mycophilum TaxID=491253 RepID=A0ABR0SPM1_9HYPO
MSTSETAMPASPGAEAGASSEATASHGSIVKQFLLDNSPEFKRLAELRQRGWENQEGDVYFQRQRASADTASRKNAEFFYGLMQRIGTEMGRATGALKITTKPSHHVNILDTCMAPGGFLAIVMKLNPGAKAVGFSLSPEEGGHEVLLPLKSKVKFTPADVTMFAADMGFTDIPAEHPDAQKFVVQRQIHAEQKFDLVVCDGQVLRTHPRAAYREWETRRLATTQLTMGLDHVVAGGTMVMLLHKLEAWNTVDLLYTFSKFSSVQTFKSKIGHATRSSFYMVATNIQPQTLQARQAVERWKKHWKVATFGSNEECQSTFRETDVAAEQMVAEFGRDLVRLGKGIWEIQADALEKAPFIKPRQA